MFSSHWAVGNIQPVLFAHSCIQLLLMVMVVLLMVWKFVAQSAGDAKESRAMLWEMI
jgi:hypothetical protein